MTTQPIVENPPAVPAVAPPPSPELSVPVELPSAFVEFVDAPKEELNRRLELARQGDAPTCDWLRRALVADPTGQLVTMFGDDLPQRISRILAARAVPDDPIGRAALLAERSRLGKELAGERPTALERVLADRVALCWLNLHAHELHYERERHNFGPSTLEAMERRLVRLNRQFNEAAKTLAVVRRLAVPAIRMFLADQQVNVLGGTGASGGQHVIAEKPPREARDG